MGQEFPPEGDQGEPGQPLSPPKGAVDSNQAAKRLWKMRFVLTGFSHNAGLRVFAFEGITPDGTRTNVWVSADMALSRRHGIRVQELPLLCLRFLQQRDTGDEKRNLTFAEEDMRVYENNCAAEREAAQRKRSPRLAHTPDLAMRTMTNLWITVKSTLTLITLRFTVAELEILLRLATDQLFRKEFIDSRLPGCRSDAAELQAGKQLVQRMKLAAGMKEHKKVASSWSMPGAESRPHLKPWLITSANNL
jgi:hypothetical protein